MVARGDGGAVRLSPARRAVLASLPAAVLLAITVALWAGWWSGAWAPVALVDAGAVSRLSLPVVTVVAHLACAVTVGGLLLAAFVVPTATARRSACVAAGGAGVVWTLAEVARTIFTYSVTAGTSVANPGFGQELAYYIRELEAGRLLAVSVVLAAVAATIALASQTPTGAAWALVAAVAALFPAAESGHASGTSFHMLAVGALLVHLVAAAAWLGGLAAMAIGWLRGWFSAAATDNGGTQAAVIETTVRRYSAIAAWALVLVAVSGVVSSVIRLDGAASIGSDYGLLIIGKVVLIAVLGACGAAQRRWVIGKVGGAGDGRVPVALLWRLVAAELVVMGAVSGLAVALAGTAPPDPGTATGPLTPAEIVTGHPLPPEPNVARWLTQVQPDLILALLAVSGAVVYVRWVLRLRRRGDAWSLGRTLSWLAAMVLFLWVTSGGPAQYGHVLFSAHMLQHMLLAMVIPIFIASAAPVTLAMRALPARRDGSRGPREWLLVLVHSRWGSFFAHPVVAAVNFAGSMIVFYYTPLFELALRTTAGHLAMVVHFSLAGYLFVNALVGVDPGPQRPGYPQRLLLLLATMAFHAFFGVTLMSSESLLVADWFGLMGRPWGQSAIADQQTGGGIAWGIGEIPTIVLAVIVAVRWAGSDERTARRQDRQADRDGDAELRAYNEMLSKLPK